MKVKEKEADDNAEGVRATRVPKKDPERTLVRNSLALLRDLLPPPRYIPSKADGLRARGRSLQPQVAARPSAPPPPRRPPRHPCRDGNGGARSLVHRVHAGTVHAAATSYATGRSEQDVSSVEKRRECG